MNRVIRGEGMAYHPPGMDPASVGRRIRVIRAAFGGMTQTDLGNLCGVSKGAVANWERGANKLEANHAAIIGARFDLTLDYIFLGKVDTLKVRIAEIIKKAESEIPD